MPLHNLDASAAPGGFCPVVVNPGRLEILTALAGGAGQQLEFVPLRRLTRLTDGNLASHAKRLQSAGLIDVGKQFRDGKPVTRFTLTSAGRAALESHLARLLAAVGASGGVNVPSEETPTRPSSLSVADVDVEEAEDDWID